MRPLRLEIEGFTCYRQRTVVDFSELDLFAITGPTGAGKTSLVDALVYALYGRIPRAGNEIKDFISQGAESLRVVLQFAVGGELYRVLRGTSRRGAAAVVQLERWAADGGAEGGCWLPEEGRVRQANERIHRLVGLDYDAFTRSVLLPQGQFHQFLAGEPRERRKILSELLRLDVYERVRERAASLQRECSRDAERIAQLLRTQYADATPERLEERRRELARREEERASAEAEHESLTGALGAARAAQEAERRRVEAEGRQRAALRRHDESRQKARAAAETLAREGPQKLALEEAVARSPYHDERYAALKAALVLARDAGRLAVRAEEAAAALAEREGAVASCMTEASEAESRLQAAEAASGEAEAAWQRAQREHAAAGLRAGLRPGDPCPVCLRPVQDVPAAGHPRLADAEAALKDARRAGEEAGQAAGGARRRLALAEQALDSARAQVDDLSQQRAARRAELESELKRSGVGREAADVEPLEADLRAQEEAREEVHSLREKLARLEARLRSLEAERQGAEAAAAELQRQAAELAEALRLAEAEAEDCRRRLEASAPPLEPPPSTLEERVEALERRDLAALRALADLQRQIGSLEEAVERLAQDIEKAVRLREEESGRRQDALLAGELAALLRADRFQAYMAGQALRLLAEDGSRHLLELSDGRYGLTAEGDDFQVVDHWHAEQPRPVRTLSGGETFLASLALALALAERLPELAAGVPAAAAGSAEGAGPSALESLFIDEGFGTLSTDALDCVTAALDSLQRGQRMVGIVTHLQELADRLPAQIVVRKTPQGSTVEQS